MSDTCDSCDNKPSHHFASPLIRAQETSVRMFDPEKLIILPYCGENQGRVDNLLKSSPVGGSDNTPYRRIWEGIDPTAIQERINLALGMVVGRVENIDVSLFCGQESTPYEIAKSPPDIIKFFEGLIRYVGENGIPHDSHLYVVTHSHFMLSIGLQSADGGKPFNNSIYLVKSFDFRTKQFAEITMMESGQDEGSIQANVESSPDISDVCDSDKRQREGMDDGLLPISPSLSPSPS
jgi:hypothetical protein